MLDVLTGDGSYLKYLLSSPLLLVGVLFQIWMGIDAVRRREWVWAFFILFFSVFSALMYFFMVYRAQGGLATRGYELPGAHSRRRIKELQAQIHHLDKPHHHLQLGDIYFQQGKLDLAEKHYRASLERDATDRDPRDHLPQCLLRKKKTAEAPQLQQAVVHEDPKHDYRHTMIDMAEK